MRANVVAHEVIALLVLFNIGEASVAEMLARLHRQTAGLVTANSSGLRAALTCLRRRGLVTRRETANSVTVFDLTETGGHAALRHRQGLACLADLTWRTA